MRKMPTVIYVSGSPGSGKTTLAKIISDKLSIPHVSSDLVHGGQRFTIGRQNQEDRLRSLFENFVPLTKYMLDHNLSFVVDQVLQKNISEKDIISNIKPKANLIYIHVYCCNPIDRHIAREFERIDDGISLYDLDKDQRAKRAEYHRSNLNATDKALDLSVPTLEVNTDNGYRPSIKEIIEFIMINNNSLKER